MLCMKSVNQNTKWKQNISGFIFVMQLLGGL